ILGGNRGNTTTIKTGTENIDVLVRLPKEQRQDINQLKNLNIKIGENKFIKVGDVADIVYGEGSLSIEKKDRIYSVTISANDNGLGTRGLQQAFVKAFQKFNRLDAISYTWGGQSENMNATMSQLSSALMIAIFLIYALIAAQFESFLLPFVVIGSIPLALIGVFLGLFILGQAMNMMTMIGIILLAGIVVNNAIVLIDFIQLMRIRGMSREQAIIEAGSTRLRPILMTTATTVLGMVPMALGFGEGSEIYRGMSLAVIFGLSVSTLLTLVVIPILYSLMDDFILFGKHFFSHFKFFRKAK
ncbi:efflux RND transporter permease subunit, partial [Fusobacterium necrophorum]|nr:efflux RND transporter permease subunit [Fusobacterium necrophorum]